MLRIYALIAVILLSFSVNAQVLSGEKARAINKNLMEVRYDQRTKAPLYLEFSKVSAISGTEGINGISSPTI